VEPSWWWQAPNLCWPDDHAWCLAAEVDLDRTYLACATACRDAVFADGRFRVCEVDPASRDFLDQPPGQ